MKVIALILIIFGLPLSSGRGYAAEDLRPSADPIADLYVFGLGLGLGVGGAVSWKYQENYTGKFTVLHEGWFGRDTYAGGADKIGHFYADFVLVRAINQIYLRHGYGEDAAILRSFLASTVIRSVMELADGYTTFKYSPEDLIANLAGALSSVLLLKNPAIDDTFGISWTYLPSQEKLDGKVDWLSIDNDYNGSIYHFDTKLGGLRRLVGINSLESLDHYNVSLSYMTRGYDRQRDLKQRILGLNVGLNLAEMLTGDRSRDSDIGFGSTVLKYFKVPFSFGGVMYDLDHHRYGVRFGLNYFY